MQHKYVDWSNWKRGHQSEDKARELWSRKHRRCSNFQRRASGRNGGNANPIGSVWNDWIRKVCFGEHDMESLVRSWMFSGDRAILRSGRNTITGRLSLAACSRQQTWRLRFQRHARFWFRFQQRWRKFVNFFLNYKLNLFSYRLENGRVKTKLSLVAMY